jgi:hypothetical protein
MKERRLRSPRGSESVETRGFTDRVLFARKGRPLWIEVPSGAGSPDRCSRAQPALSGSRRRLFSEDAFDLGSGVVDDFGVAHGGASGVEFCEPLFAECFRDADAQVT